MRLTKSLNHEAGFSLAEILVAGVILALALVPISRMFDVSFTGLRQLERVQGGVGCAKATMELVRSIPFYEPHTDENQNQDFDIDDCYWGRPADNPTFNPAKAEGGPDWDSIPEVEFRAKFPQGIGNALRSYENYYITIQLCYLEDSTGVAEMKSDWAPKAMGRDRPRNKDNIPLHLLLVRVNVYWQQQSDQPEYYLEGVVSDTEALYNVGISEISVTGPASIMNPARYNAAAHWSNPNVDVQVTIKGYGFDDVNDADGVVQASLVRDKHYDIPIDLTYRSGTELRGTLRLYTGHNESSSINPWNPKAAIGYWTVRINQQQVVAVYLYNGFVVEYPKPVIADFGNSPDYGKTITNNVGAATLLIKGGPFCTVAQNPAVKLVQVVDEGETPYEIVGNVTSVSVPAGTSGYSPSPNCVITATFDMTKAPAGEYRMMVVNSCNDPTQWKMIGNRESDPSDQIYTVIEVTPEVDDVYTYSTHLHEAPYNVGNPWRLVFEGRYFNISGSPSVEMYLCSDVVDGNPAGNYIKGTVYAVSPTVAVADFDLSSLPVGFYKGYLKNLNDNKAGWTAGSPFQVTEFNANIGGFVPNAGYAFYENYYDIPSKITGNGFLSATRVTITNGTVEHDLTGEYTVTNNNEIAVNLNLIGCRSTDAWKVRVYFGPSYYLERAFTVSLGPAKILPPSNTKYAIRIYRMGWWFTDSWSNETTSTKAQAIRSYWFGTAKARFEVLGMGFPVSGQTRLTVWKDSWSASGDYSCYMDRANKIVRLTSSDWNMPNISSGDAGISVQRLGDSYVDSYPTRWRLID
ncbi:MAG: hypothetical protein H5T74_01730 [Actinobacteria bacterium]|nr:hypothetical protein [Actinomycetota bacterium]